MPAPLGGAGKEQMRPRPGHPDEQQAPLFGRVRARAGWALAVGWALADGPARVAGLAPAIALAFAAGVALAMVLAFAVGLALAIVLVFAAGLAPAARGARAGPGQPQGQQA